MNGHLKKKNYSRCHKACKHQKYSFRRITSFMPQKKTKESDNNRCYSFSSTHVLKHNTFISGIRIALKIPSQNRLLYLCIYFCDCAIKKVISDRYKKSLCNWLFFFSDFQEKGKILKTLNFITWFPKRLKPLIASKAAFANPTELRRNKQTN